MAVNVSVDYARNDLSQLEYKYDLISCISDDELEAVQKIAIAFLNKNRELDINNNIQSLKPFLPQTEDQLLKRIDRSLAQADVGMCIDADEVIDEMLAECDNH